MDDLDMQGTERRFLASQPIVDDLADYFFGLEQIIAKMKSRNIDLENSNSALTTQNAVLQARVEALLHEANRLRAALRGDEGAIEYE